MTKPEQKLPAKVSSTEVSQIPHHEQSRSLITRMATRYGVDSEKFLSTIKATCFKGDGKREVTNEQLCALLVIAEQFGLNIWLKELHAFPSQDGGVTPIIGVDGFIKIANSNPQFAGMSFEYDDAGEWVECIIERKDRTQPTRIREYMAECKRDTSPWRQWPRRMLRHRALCQAVRVAFGFSVMETDEAEAWIEGEIKDVTPRGKPETQEPQRKKIIQDNPGPSAQTAAAAGAESTAAGSNLEQHITLDQATYLADSMKAEGVKLEALLNHFQVAHIELLPAAKYESAVAFILSA